MNRTIFNLNNIFSSKFTIKCLFSQENYSDIPTPLQANQCSTTSIRSTSLKSKHHTNDSKHSPSRIVTSTQDKSKEPPSSPQSPLLKKRKTDSDENDRLTDSSDIELKNQNIDEMKEGNSSINPFAVVPNNKSLHSEIDISAEFIEPKLELPDYSEEDTSHDESQNFMDMSDAPNSFSALPGESVFILI